mgnify:CR=1 FL=1
MTMSTPGRLGIGIIGMGHVGPVIGSALRAVGHQIVAVSASSDASRERADAMLPGVPLASPEEVVRRSEVVILAVPDDQIGPLVSGLADLGAWQTGHIVIHLSGASGVGLLAPASTAGAIPLAIHPAMTFTGTSVDVARLVGTPFAVTAAAPFLPIAQALVVEMGGEPVHVAEADRALYHAALAHASNHLVTLLGQSQQMLASIGIEDPARYLGPLVRATVDNALASGEGALTGPVARGDAGTLDAHLNALIEYTDHENTQDIADSYAAMVRATASRAHNRNLLNDDQKARIESTLRTHTTGTRQSGAMPDDKEFSS